MGMKRAFHEDVHPSRRQNLQPSVGKPAKRARVADAKDLQAHTKSVNYLKGKVRDLVRLLKRDALPADVRIEKERALHGYKADLQRLEAEKERKVMIGRYHMVRFFERQKAQRALKKLTSQASQLSRSFAEDADLAAKMHEATVDLNYTMYFPLNEKYQSLYPRIAEQGPKNSNSIGSMGKREIGGQRPPLWSLVEKAMADGTLKELRDGKLRTTLTIGRTKSEPKLIVEEVTTPKNVAEKSKGDKIKLAGDEHDQQDELSDGGFFEE